MIYNTTTDELSALLKVSNELADIDSSFIDDMSRLLETGLTVDDDPEPFTDKQCMKIHQLWKMRCEQ